jgi:predicted DNA-binding transcriptional regulator AlpA
MSSTNKKQLMILPIRPRNLRIPQLIAYSGLSRSTIYQDAAKGLLNLSKIGRATVCNLDEADRWLSEKTTPISDAPKVTVAKPTVVRDNKTE